MRILLQRVSRASVESGGITVGQIGVGLLAFLGVSATDTPALAGKLAGKISRLRIFPDGDGKTNLSAQDVNGGILVVSQFTLYADCKKGNRPSFTGAGDPRQAEAVYEHFIQECRGQFQNVASGAFGAEMKVSLVNEGPFTIMLEEEISP